MTTGAGKTAPDTFDKAPVGKPSAARTRGVTGGGSPKWAVAADGSAPTQRNVFEQSGAGTSPWGATGRAALAVGLVEVRLKPVAGREDQAGGLVRRLRDGGAYYVARANAPENRVSLYHTELGEWIAIEHVDAPVAPGRWHRLRV
jgi:hypothetical protein